MPVLAVFLCVPLGEADGPTVLLDHVAVCVLVLLDEPVTPDLLALRAPPCRYGGRGRDLRQPGTSWSVAGRSARRSPRISSCMTITCCRMPLEHANCEVGGRPRPQVGRQGSRSSRRVDDAIGRAIAGSRNPNSALANAHRLSDALRPSYSRRLGLLLWATVTRISQYSRQ
jgi:hypothetical protein